MGIKFNFALITFALIVPFQVIAKTPEKSFENVLKRMSQSGTRVSAQIVNLTNTRNVLDVDSDRALNPASSIKLFTAYNALKRLGINYQFKTDVYKNKDGSLCVKGSGDPSFVMEDMYLLVEALKRKVLESYSGKIGLDATAFDEEMYGDEREQKDSERAYNAPIAGLNFNYNTITVFVNPTRRGEPARVGIDFPFENVQIHGKVMTGSVTDVSWDKKAKDDLEIVNLGGKIAEGVEEWHKPFRMRDPKRGFGYALSKMLEERGVKATTKVSVKDATCIGTPLHRYETKPLSFIVQLMDKYSNNFIADSLVKVLDHEVNGHPGTTLGGMKFERDEMKKIGIDATAKGRNWVSGSGLTLQNAISASDFIKLLKHINQEKLFLPEIFTSLPIAALDGTLKKKYGHTDVSERLRGKTGTLNGVQSLVGIYPNSAGEWLGIAIIVNGSQGIPENDLAQFLGTL